MKIRLFVASWLMVMSMTLFVWADVDIDQQDIGSEDIQQPAKRTPFSFDTYIDVIGASKIHDKGNHKGDKVHYAQSKVEGGMVVYYCPKYTEGARVALGFLPTYLYWNDNIWFEQDHFNTLTLSIGGFTKRIDQWFWRAQVTANFDSDKWKSRYTSYDILLWGRYEYCEHIGFHFGFLAETGLKMDRIYPILGFDWQISRKLKLNLVYPVNISLMYSLSPSWSIGAAGRLFNSRFRVHHSEHALKPLVRYTNTGAEIILKYENATTSANIHAGTTLGGLFRVSDNDNEHASHYHLKPSGYVGAEIDVKF